MAQNFSLDSKMPHYAKVAWSINTSTSTKGLNAYKITQAAIDIADSKGLDAVTIRSIAEQTGFSTMAVYRHITSRDELMLLLIERVLGQAPSFEATSWQQNVKAWATKLRQRYASHSWVLALPIAGMPTMPNRISWVEQILRILAPTGLSLQARLDVALLLDGHVRQFASISTSKDTKKASVQDLEWLQEVASDAAPTLMLALQQGAMQSQKGPDFTIGLNTIIAGIESLDS